ncbi:MAG TPA: phosphatase PAP2 family protein [Acidimicrobiales bacterium]|nr:phosphatase PAP2 family protein [Acidimicrobiales bacterium]
MTANGGRRRLVVGAALVLGVTGLLAARDRLLFGEAGVVEALNGNALLGGFPVEPLLVSIMIFGTVIGVAGVTVGAVVFLKPWQAPVQTALAGSVAWAGAHVLKALIDRGRPLEYLDARTLEISQGYATLTGPGYPSGHAAVAFALATALSPWLAPRHRWVAWTVAALVALARVHVAAHFPLDVIGGAALGILAGALALTLVPPPTLDADADADV